MSVKVKVRATVVVTVELPDDFDDDLIRFHIEENNCPGTSAVGAEIERLMRDGEERSVCWACNAEGKNEVLEIARRQAGT